MTNTGHNNTGHYNTGDRNTGHNNTGNRNTGHNNTGHNNTGNNNTGYFNTGDFNTGDFNTGDRNTGYCNTGHNNTGDCNTGDSNIGDYNTGHNNTGYSNTGHYNIGDFHVGCFNTVSAEKAYYFNKLINKADWDNAEMPRWLYHLPQPTWVYSSEMTDAEKAENPSHETTGGFLRENDIKEHWSRAFAKATPEDIELTKAMPAFDAEVFLEITGIDLRDKPVAAQCDGREVEIDGVVYVLKAKGSE